MAATTKSSQTAKNVVIALLALWSIISLIVIVVWATSPDLKKSVQCNKELRDMTEKMREAEVTYNRNNEAAAEMVQELREEKARQKAEILLLLGQINATNASLEECQQEKVVLNRNISMLEENVEQLRQREANLTTLLELKEDHIEALQQNLTQATYQTNSCLSLKAAAESNTLAATTQNQACESRQQYLQKQLQKCKVVPSEAPRQTQQQGAAPTPSPSAATSPFPGIPALALLVCSALHLIT